MLARLQRRNAIDESRRAFETTFAREILRSEQLRVAILAGVFGLTPLLFFLIAALFPREVEQIFHGAQSPYLTLAAIGFIYELGGWFVLRYFIQKQFRFPDVAYYVNALLETSVPTLIVILMAGILHPLDALASAATLTYFLFIVLATLRLKFWLCVFTGAVAAVEYFLVAAYYIGMATSVDPLLGSLPTYIAKAIIYLVAGCLAGFVARQLKNQFVSSLRTIEERNRIVDIFGQHVSPAVVDKLLAQQVDLDGEVRHVCLLFLDIRGFTAFAEKRKPSEVVQYLNVIFECAIECVNRHHGIVNKFLGDGFMAVFGAPLEDGADIQHAVDAAMDIVAQVEQLNVSGRIAPTRVSIGLHAGEAVTGNVGSSARKEYTIIGDTVNLAARLENLNRQFGSQVLISDAVWHAVNLNGHRAEALGHIHVHGHEQTVQVFKLA